MNSACIVLQKKINPSNDGVCAIIDGLSANGCAPTDVQFLLNPDEMRFKESLQTLRKNVDVVVLLADRNELTPLKERLSAYYKEDIAQNVFCGACIFQSDRSTLFLMSADDTETGVGYLKNVCIPYLQQKTGARHDKIILRAVGANESRVKGLLAQALNMSGNQFHIFHTRNYDEDVMEISYDSNTPKMLIDDVLRLLTDGFGDTVYALNTDATLEEQLVSLLKLRGKKISVAESFTGGGVAKRITSVSGASQVYFEGLNTYDELSKIKRLGVSEYTLQTVGAVSDQTAYEMALGLLNTGCCDIAIATTGLAGPKTDRSMLPVGLCFIAVGVKEQILVYRYKFDGTRKDVTEKAINYALYLAYKHLKKL